jgi:hypothetical protein
MFGGEVATATATIRSTKLDGTLRSLLSTRASTSTVGAVAGRRCVSDAAHFRRLSELGLGTSPSYTMQLIFIDVPFHQPALLAP